MEAPKAPTTPPALSIIPATFEIVLAEDATNPLAFVSPPLRDISEMAELERSSFSLTRGAKESEAIQLGLRQRLDDLLKKQNRFAESATFHNRLANAQRALGNLADEISSASRAASLDDRVFFKRKLGETYFRAGEQQKAADIFNGLADRDAYSALRIASLHVLNNDIDTAEEWVLKAVDIEPDGYAERLFQGAIRLYKGDYQTAIRLFWMALHERPNSSVAYCNLALAYLGDNKVKNAFNCFKRSVALDPLNRSAVLALADVGFLLGRDADVVTSLRYYVQFEQRENAVWGRLARSLLKIDAVDECIAALKRQGALERSVSLWNNLGVAYAKRGLKEQSLEAFNYALTIDAGGGTREEMIVARNTAQLISTLGKPELLHSVTKSLISGDENLDLARDPQLCDIYGFHISALMKLRRKPEALKLAARLLSEPSLGEQLAKWLFTSLAAILGVEDPSSPLLHFVLESFLESDFKNSSDAGLINNISFALAESGRLDEAEACLSLAARAFHKNPYVTATLGLINLKRGRRGRGEDLYKEAISIAKTSRDKTRIRQKFFLEIGKLSLESDSVQSRRALQRVIKEKHGEDALVRQASELLRSLERHRLEAN